MSGTKHEASDDAGGAEKRRRGKSRQGGDLCTLLLQHNIRAVPTRDVIAAVRNPHARDKGYDGDAAVIKDLGARMVSRADLPSVKHLMHVAWIPPMTEWEAKLSYEKMTRSARTTPLMLNVASHEQESRVLLDQLASTRICTSECAYADDPLDSKRAACVLDVGGHVYDLGWAPFRDEPTEYLAVACTSQRGAVEQDTKDGAVQIWAYTPDSCAAHLACTLTLESAPLRLSWRPGVPAANTIGTLAVSLMDGTIAIFDIPSTDLDCIQVRPHLRLRIPDTSCFSLAWGGDARLASGCANGHVGVWDLDAGEAPIVNAPVHDTLVSALSWQMLPPIDPACGAPDLTARPHILFSVGWDGSEHVTDVMDVYATTRLAHSREPRYACAWAPWSGAWVIDLGDHQFGTVSLRTQDSGRHHVVGFHHGRITVRT